MRPAADRIARPGGAETSAQVGPHRHAAPPGHLPADLFERLPVEHARGHGEELAVFDGNVRLIERLECGQVFAQRRGVGRLEPAVVEPAADERVHDGVMGVGRVVVVFELLHHGQHPVSLGVATGAQAGKQAVFLVSGMVRRGRLEVLQGPLERLAVIGRELAPGERPVDGDEHLQEMLDAPVAVAQQAERFVESVIGPGPDLDTHDPDYDATAAAGVIARPTCYSAGLMRSWILRLALCGVACATLGAGIVRLGAQQPEARRVRALLISSGAFHDYLRQSEIFVDTVGKAVPVDWTIALQGDPRGTTTRYPIYESPDWARGFDIVVHNECSADVADPAFIRTIVDAHRTGGAPAMVIHCAMHSYRAAEVDDWREFLGVTSRVHTPQFRIPVQWTDEALVSGMQTGWTTPLDELYVIEKIWPGARPLATAVDARNGREYPVAWTHDYHGARVFGTTLGHDIATWEDPVYQQLLVRGFQWAIGRDRQQDR